MMHSFRTRHIGISVADEQKMLKKIGVESLDELINQTIPQKIRITDDLNIPESISEFDYIKHIKHKSQKNILYSNFIGQGYYGTITPSVILRNIFQNPGWYTQYTPYQAEISQGRLEALLNFQTMVSDLTGMQLANASLLDEATAAAEAMAMFYSLKNKRKIIAEKFFVDQDVFPHTLDVILSRATPLNIEVIVGDFENATLTESFFGALVQYPSAKGVINDYSKFAADCKTKNIYTVAAADLLSLTLLEPPGEWGVDAVVGTTQRFGVPIGYGGPHAAYFATREQFKRNIPGRIIGVSQDRLGNRALRMALQTREQHIKRERATSNICTAQALLAIMAGMYAVYHGPKGIQSIAQAIFEKTSLLKNNIKKIGFSIIGKAHFDTVSIPLEKQAIKNITELSKKESLNLFIGSDYVSFSVDETHNNAELEKVYKVFCNLKGVEPDFSLESKEDPIIRKRVTDFLTHPIFNSHHSETSMMRYIKSLENKDLSLMHAMIPLGSCTMKLNAASELLAVSIEEFSNLHPFVPADQAQGYREIFTELESHLSTITGFTACSLQPNSGAQGEYTGLMVIRAYHESRNEHHRNIALIPSSAHGTNPASAVMAGMKVVIVSCDEKGNIELADLKEKAKLYKDNLSALMITYPSTHGVFEEAVIEICETIHLNGGLVYMDGANMNAQVGLTSPNKIGADVCHLNLHKTFAIPHGGGGPGMGPICVNDKLKPFLPGHHYAKCGGNNAIKSVSAAPWGSASILLISYAYILMLGKKGLTDATKYSILNANYLKSALEKEYKILYSGENGRSAHEFIIDLRDYKHIGVSAEDVAKRLIDYGFHAPTLSFPVPGTIMIEPTESEDKTELDRFISAMLNIKKEIDQVAKGDYPTDNNPLRNAPHPLHLISADRYELPYPRSIAAYPEAYLVHKNKFWPSVARVDNAYGDRNLVCSCPPLEHYQD